MWTCGSLHRFPGHYPEPTLHLVIVDEQALARALEGRVAGVRIARIRDPPSWVRPAFASWGTSAIVVRGEELV